MATVEQSTIDYFNPLTISLQNMLP